MWVFLAFLFSNLFSIVIGYFIGLALCNKWYHEHNKTEEKEEVKNEI